MTNKNTRQAAGGLPTPLARLYEWAGLPAWSLPPVLVDVYGGDLGFPQPCVYANFVASVDGVTALGPEYPSSGSAISGHDPADRFVMGLLRASGLLDELFLTISPVLAGRADTARPGLVAGLELLPGRAEPAELLTVRRHGSYLLLRYAMRGKDTPGGR